MMRCRVASMLITLSPTSLPVDQFREELNAICGAFEVLPGADRSVMRGAVAHEVRGGFDVAHVAKDAQCIRRGRSEIGQHAAPGRHGADRQHRAF